MCRCGFYRFWSSDHHEQLVWDRLAAFMQIAPFSVFSLERSAEV